MIGTRVQLSKGSLGDPKTPTKCISCRGCFSPARAVIEPPLHAPGRDGAADRGEVRGVARIPPTYGVEKRLADTGGDRAALGVSDRAPVDRLDPGDLHAGAAEEGLVGDVELRAVNRALFDRDAGILRELDHRAASDAFE